jgi:hypothetical protein
VYNSRPLGRTPRTPLLIAREFVRLHTPVVSSSAIFISLTNERAIKRGARGVELGIGCSRQGARKEGDGFAIALSFIIVRSREGCGEWSWLVGYWLLAPGRSQGRRWLRHRLIIYLVARARALARKAMASPSPSYLVAIWSGKHNVLRFLAILKT